MDLTQAMQQRHSVRRYKDTPLSESDRQTLCTLIDRMNQASGLHIQLVTDEPKAFGGGIAHYGIFTGVSNYIALIGPKAPDLEEKCGYYGEQLVLEAQRMGLNTCWVALTFRKVPDAYVIEAGEKLAIVIAIGYGETQGTPHRGKRAEQVSNLSSASPEWFRKGVEAALLAPTAINQQKFTLLTSGEKVRAKAGFGPYARIDLGIVKYHFELGAGKENFLWE